MIATRGLWRSSVSPLPFKTRRGIKTPYRNSLNVPTFLNKSLKGLLKLGQELENVYQNGIGDTACLFKITLHKPTWKNDLICPHKPDQALRWVGDSALGPTTLRHIREDAMADSTFWIWYSLQKEGESSTLPVVLPQQINTFLFRNGGLNDFCNCWTQRLKNKCFIGGLLYSQK